MTRKLPAYILVTAALVMLAGGVLPSAGARLAPWRGFELSRHSAASQLPAGLVLPASEAHLAVSSLVAADLDADGDLDIIATDASEGSVGIVVWVNDGDGRLTRKHPRKFSTFGSEPESPSVAPQEATMATSIQPDAPAVAAIGINTWVTLPSQPFVLPLSPDVPSAARAASRSRSPPARS